MRLFAVMCGTPKLSRVMVSPGRAGNVSGVPCTGSPPSPNTFTLKKFGRSAIDTLLRFGVSPS